MSVPLKTLLAHLDLPELHEVAADLLAAGRTREQVIDDIVALVDAAVPWEAIIPGPAGAVVEAVDAPLAKAIARFVVGAAERKRKKAA